jgi:hypothetical protein
MSTKPVEVTAETYMSLKGFAGFFRRNHYLGHIDTDDYIQEAAIATWRGRKKPKSAMIDHFRRHAPLSRAEFRDDVPLPVFMSLEDWDTDEMTCDYDMDELLDIAQLWELMQRVPESAWVKEFPDIPYHTLKNYLEEVRSCLNY